MSSTCHLGIAAASAVVVAVDFLLVLGCSDGHAAAGKNTFQTMDKIDLTTISPAAARSIRQRLINEALTGKQMDLSGLPPDLSAEIRCAIKAGPPTAEEIEAAHSYPKFLLAASEPNRAIGASVLVLSAFGQPTGGKILKELGSNAYTVEVFDSIRLVAHDESSMRHWDQFKQSPKGKLCQPENN